MRARECLFDRQSPVIMHVAAAHETLQCSMNVWPRRIMHEVITSFRSLGIESLPHSQLLSLCPPCQSTRTFHSFNFIISTRMTTVRSKMITRKFSKLFHYQQNHSLPINLILHQHFLMYKSSSYLLWLLSYGLYSWVVMDIAHTKLSE